MKICVKKKGEMKNWQLLLIEYWVEGKHMGENSWTVKERIKYRDAYILTIGIKEKVEKYWGQYFFWRGGGYYMATMLRYNTCVCDCVQYERLHEIWIRRVYVIVCSMRDYERIYENVCRCSGISFPGTI